uniref:Uncharacterized protein n=1 Tax=Amphora coffeiformis TaxID=265554 RepID=A0A7S3L429_9STRA|eukprot:scaffold38364_cov191-Amphora_coffeaeformis.AAC.1
MPLDSFVARSMGAALWDTRPTKTDKRAQQLAAALGYPEGWRVVREIVSTETHPTIIVDRIYAGDPSDDVDCWFHHAAAQQAAAKWEEEGGKNPHAHKGGHLLARQARYNKGDKVQAFFEEEWWDARIVRRKEHATGFRYQVHYAADNSKQSGVPEEWIRPRPSTPNKKGQPQKDPAELAAELGFGEGWQAESTGGKRYRITDPSGNAYMSKAKAMEAYLASDSGTARDEGDPPWRTDGHEWINKRVERRHIQAVTARRNVTVIQYGTISGWIAATDVDKAGNPGYCSEKTGEPACLFHVVYDDDPNNPYPSHLIEFQDLEEHEVTEMLVKDDGAVPPAAAAK